MIIFLRFLNGKLSGRFTRVIAWSVVPIGLLLTTAIALHIKSIADQLEKRNFLAACNQIQSMIANRMEDHARILTSGASFFDASETVTREAWRIFTHGMKVDKQLPGIQGLGFSLLIPSKELARHTEKINKEGFPEYQVRPAGEREVYSSIIYLEPFSGRNLRAFGYDMFSEPVRRAAMERARDTDAAALSGKVMLVQETDEAVQAGTLMYVPVYRKGMPHETVEQRRAALFGWVYSPYRMTDLLQGILGSNKVLHTSQLALSIYDDTSPSPQSLLFRYGPVAGTVQDVHQPLITFNGQRWLLCFAHTWPSLFSANYSSVWLMLIGGVLATLLLSALIGALMNTKNNALRLAKEITADLQKSEESLRQVTDRLSLATRAGGVGIWDYDVVNNLLVWDDQMFRLYGIAREQFSGAYEAWQAGLHPADRQRGDKRIQLALRGEKEFDIEFRVLWPNGTIRYIRGFAMVKRDGAGNPLRMIGTNWDITELKLAGENIMHQASLINSLLDSMPDIIFFKDVEGRYLGCNPHFAEFVGRSKEEIVGKTDYDLFAKTIADAFRENDRCMLEMNELRHNEEWITYPDGRKNLIDTLKTPYWGPDGELIGILGISRDITARHQAEVALRESEANFRTFFESMTDLIMVATPDGRIVFTNAAVPETLGYSLDELKGMLLLDLHPVEVRQEAVDTVSAMFRGERESCPLPLKRKDGVLVPVETRIWLGKWDGMDCLFGICKDLTAEQEATQRFERLFQSNPCPIALSTLPDRRFVEVNDAFVEILGYSRKEVTGNSSANLGIFAHLDQQTLLAERLVKEGRVSNMEMQIRRQDGTLLDGLLSGETFTIQGTRYLMTVMIDITARKRSEAALASLSTIQHTLMMLATNFVNTPLEQQDVAIRQSLETMGRLINADRAYLFEYDSEKEVTSNTHEWCNEGITPEIANLQNVPIAAIPDWFSAHQQGEETHVPDVLKLPSNNNLRNILEPQGIRSLITLPLMQGSSCVGFVGFDAVKEARIWKEEEFALLRVLAELYSNFEARRNAERAMRELQDHLAKARDKAQEAARAKTLFLANMSHEIRTPLNAILGYAQVIGRDCRKCELAQRIKGLTKSSEHLLTLINDLLELARSDGQCITLAPSSFNFTHLLEDVRLMFARRLDALSLNLEVSQTIEGPCLFYADSGKIRQVLMNLVSNAIKFTENDGVVRLSASVLEKNDTDGLLIAVDVEDTGCGIQDADKEIIFELFACLETGKMVKGGIGLGLPLSRRYARALGGDVTVESRIGVGSNFRFTFRVSPCAADAHPKSFLNVTHLSLDQGDYRVLIVDDDASNRDMLSSLLKSVGFVVELAESAMQAVQRLHPSDQPKIDMVLLDKCMPDIDGYEAVHLLRSLPDGARIKILIVTASGFPDQREEVHLIGADGFVSKPIQLSLLLEEIACVGGVRYDYEATSISEPARPDSEVMSILQTEEKDLLKRALRRGDSRSLRDLTAKIASVHPSVAERIQPYVDAYNYDGLRRLLDGDETGVKHE